MSIIANITWTAFIACLAGQIADKAPIKNGAALQVRRH
jgi:hypothetical protein